jgi:hypothetical protein
MFKVTVYIEFKFTNNNEFSIVPERDTEHFDNRAQSPFRHAQTSIQ